MKAAIWRAPGQPMEVAELTLTGLGPKEVRVKVGAAGVCSTDAISTMTDVAENWRAPQVFGHAGVGTVEEVGTEVTRARVGDRVVISVTGQCHECRWCIDGHPDQCVSTPLEGEPRYVLADGTPVVRNAGVGSYAEEVVVGQAQIVPVETDLSDVVLSLLGCPASTGLGGALIAAPVRAGATVAVLGCGPVGLSYIQGARLAGAAQIIAVDPVEARREAALALGATTAVDPTAEEEVAFDPGADPYLLPSESYTVEKVRSLTSGLGADFVFEASASSKAMSAALPTTRRGGDLVFSSIPWEGAAGRITLQPVDAACFGRTIHSCQLGSTHLRRDIPRFVELVESGAVDLESMVTKTWRLDEIDDAIGGCADHAEIAAAVVPA